LLFCCSATFYATACTTDGFSYSLLCCCLQDKNDATFGDDSSPASNGYNTFNSPNQRISYDTSNDDIIISSNNSNSSSSSSSNASASTAGNTNNLAAPKPSRLITFNLGDTSAAAADLTMNLSDYAAHYAAFHTERCKINSIKLPSPTCAAPSPASPTQITALNARKAGRNTEGLTAEEKAAAKAHGAAQRSAHLAAINAKAAARDAMLAGFTTQEEVDAYYAAEVAATAADEAAEEAVGMSFAEEFALLGDLIAHLEAAKNANANKS
jgi:hypothetical protein